MMFCQKEKNDHVLGNHKGGRDHLLSTELTTFVVFRVKKGTF